jgi:hypothetical protein
VPLALELQDEYEDILQVVFVESQGATPVRAQQFAIDKGWFNEGTAAMWTTERPFSTGMGGLPSYALLDDTGEVLLKGITTRDHKKIEEAIEDYAKARKKGPADLPKSVAKAVADFHKGKPTKALDTLEGMLAEGSRAKPDEKAGAEKALASLGALLERDLARVDWLLGNGYYAVAEGELEELAKELKGADLWLEKVAERSERLESDELAEERKAEQALLKLEKKLYTKGSDKVSAKSLYAIGDKYPGSRAAARAEALVPVVDTGS